MCNSLAVSLSLKISNPVQLCRSLWAPWSRLLKHLIVCPPSHSSFQKQLFIAHGSSFCFFFFKFLIFAFQIASSPLWTMKRALLSLRVLENEPASPLSYSSLLTCTSISILILFFPFVMLVSTSWRRSLAFAFFLCWHGWTQSTFPKNVSCQRTIEVIFAFTKIFFVFQYLLFFFPFSHLS